MGIIRTVIGVDVLITNKMYPVFVIIYHIEIQNLFMKIMRFSSYISYRQASLNISDFGNNKVRFVFPIQWNFKNEYCQKLAFFSLTKWELTFLENTTHRSFHCIYNINTAKTNFQLGWSSWYSPGKLGFHFKKIATDFFLPQCISIRSPECYPKNPPKSQLRN